MLARDLRAFLARGYVVELVQPFDMFPQTFHVETLAVLRLAGAGREEGRVNPTIGSWGDQGDGTYRNPILNADYPDVDVERLGDRYYMITSTMHYAPGMTLLESRDLVNWTLIGHLFDTLDWEPEYNWDRMGHYSFGVWAADLAYNDGTWYCYLHRLRQRSLHEQRPRHPRALDPPRVPAAKDALDRPGGILGPRREAGLAGLQLRTGHPRRRSGATRYASSA